MSKIAWCEQIFSKLMVEAASKHSTLFRKGKNTNQPLKVPYIIHPLQVVQKLERWGICEDTNQHKLLWKAALFHDYLEDVPDCDQVELEEMIGEKSFQIVQELTNTSKSKSKYLESFKEKSVQALVIKIADRICNSLDFKNDQPKYAKTYFFKAEILFTLLRLKKKEIIQLYGEAVYDSIISEVEELELDFSSEVNF